MLRSSLLALALTALGVGATGCGAGVAGHSGYKSPKAKPWKKPKVIKLDDKGAGKAAGDLDYADYRRAKWYAVDLTSPGEMTVELTVTAPTDDDDFDLALEVLDPDNRVISKADADEEDAHELQKSRTLYELQPGRYLIHLYLQRRTDTAEYKLAVAVAHAGPMTSADFPSRVAFLPSLPAVPTRDDNPGGARPHPPSGGGKPKPPKPEPEPEPSGTGPVSARIINVTVSGGGSVITINRGTDHGLAVGMHGTVEGIKNGSFELSSCTTRSCKGTVKATPDEVNRSGKATVRP